jgi:hypothetical protein
LVYQIKNTVELVIFNINAITQDDAKNAREKINALQASLYAASRASK